MIPKFRAWDVDDQKMTQWKDLILEKDEGLNNWFIGHKEGTMTSYWHEQVLMQSTGLFDKKGKEIFEGDIVKFTVTNKSMCGLYRVRRATSGEWRIDNRTQGRSLYIAGSRNCEVIGNIYENQDLLEVENV